MLKLIFQALRRHAEQRFDQLIALLSKGLTPTNTLGSIENEVRLALCTVNFSTGHYLKLLLLTLAEQTGKYTVKQIVIADNGSNDGSREFVRRLAEEISVISIVENNSRLSHARGMRSCVKKLEEMDKTQHSSNSANVLLFVDTDIIFRCHNTLSTIASLFLKKDADFVGEYRSGVNKHPDMQASFFAIRRGTYYRKTVLPLVNHGSPAYWLQRSLAWSNARIVDFPANRNGYILHRGRSGVAAAAQHTPSHSYAGVQNNHPHYMGIPNGENIWAEVEARFANLLAPDSEGSLIKHLKKTLVK